jgi:hypothetical protein
MTDFKRFPEKSCQSWQVSEVQYKEEATEKSTMPGPLLILELPRAKASQAKGKVRVQQQVEQDHWHIIRQ